MIQNRLKKLRQLMKERNLEALLITNANNRRYMTGFTGSAGVVVVTADRAVLLSDFRYRTQAPREAPDFEFIEHSLVMTDTVGELLGSMGVKELAVEGGSLTVSAFEQYKAAWPGVKLLPVDSPVDRLRMVKDESELAIIQEAADIADRTFSHIVDWIRPGMTEREVALEIEFFMRAQGATSSSFDTIVASGERSALPHGVASDRVIGKDEFVKLDFGAYYKGYCSDITRTIFIGKPTDKHREIYEIVLEAQLACLAGLKPGLTGKQGDALARDVIERHGYGDLFGHGTGHGIGLEIHEAPRLSRSSSAVLEPGMVVTVEPGIYVPGFGGVRIEDDVVLTDGGIRILTSSPKELLIVG
ncbi:M24 family metallopeptidase [Paenibacillus thermoaerophilus]|uniref:M24 family metallopeptidase n=1 Tax=Paenibacillus thermoaerophilus TaxID=1215385 RepID=A0ABW2V4C9_9BACL|nr:Xaa-Pro peptidase family protein [Paenibacillus thermoaerophilus]TMV18798.1 aminopeptidase P family protein [Paenibacillus thermoaerophilus]